MLLAKMEKNIGIFVRHVVIDCLKIDFKFDFSEIDFIWIFVRSDEK